MYEHLQSLELGFFDGQQTGQLMSRATVDLQAVRFFLGYGLDLPAPVGDHDRDRGGGDGRGRPRAGCGGARADAVRDLDRLPLRKRNRPATQEVQQRIAELTAEAEENIGGVRVVKAFAQEPRQLRRFSEAVARVFEQSMISTRLRAFYSPFIGFLPQLGLAALLLVGGRQAINGTITDRRVHRVLRLRADAHRSDALARHGARGWHSGRWRAARASSSCSTASRASRRRLTRGRCHPAAGASSCAT